MSNRGMKRRVAVLWVAGFVAGLLMSVAPSRALVSEPVYDFSGATIKFGLLADYDVAPAPFATMLSYRPEPFRAALGSGSNTSLDVKWSSVTKGLSRDQAVLRHCRDDVATCPSAARAFLVIVDRAQNRSGWGRIAEVNRSINLSIRAVSDLKLYGVRDLWATPLVTFTSNAGDCEDLAIAKYAALRELGYGENDLRLVIANDSDANEIHAVIAVRHEGRWLILDNKTLEIKADTAFTRLKPLFMIDSRGVHEVAALPPQLGDTAWTTASAVPVAIYFPGGWPQLLPTM